jgi:hypothetical protein
MLYPNLVYCSTLGVVVFTTRGAITFQKCFWYLIGLAMEERNFILSYSQIICQIASLKNRLKTGYNTQAEPVPRIEVAHAYQKKH